MTGSFTSLTEWWFRICGRGISLRDHRRYRPLFSERHNGCYGRRRGIYVHVGPYCLHLLVRPPSRPDRHLPLPLGRRAVTDLNLTQVADGWCVVHRDRGTTVIVATANDGSGVTAAEALNKARVLIAAAYDDKLEFGAWPCMRDEYETDFAQVNDNLKLVVLRAAPDGNVSVAFPFRCRGRA